VNKIKTKLVFVGAGGFGREVAWQTKYIKDFNINYDVLGFIDDAVDLKEKIINGIPVIGDIEYLIKYPNEIAAAICIGTPKIRKNVINRLISNPLISFPTFVTCDTQLSDTVNIGRGCIICFSNILTVNIKIGNFVITNLDCTIGHDAIIDDYVTLYPSVNVSGNVHIGTCTEIGTGVNIIQNIKIGEKSIIGAGSVVVKDIPANCTAIGVPALPIKYHK
jgi:sugar O-acyltransferase (sialic acid O-acetyltransferase NeuD family)